MKLTVVGLADFGKLHPQALSGGMKKRGAVARALSLDPEILVLDEPTAGLDPIAAATLDELILLLKQTLQMTGARLSEESHAAEEMIARFTRWQGKNPQSIAADASYGNGALLQWLMDPQITP